MSEVVIKRIGLDEADLVIELFDRYRVFYKQASDRALAEQFITERLSSNESVVFVAMMGEQAVGFTQLYPKYSSMRAVRNWILNDLYVDADHRKFGIGTKLIQAARDFAKDAGAKFVQLEQRLIIIPRKVYMRVSVLSCKHPIPNF
ncbi:GNAT family N-acetyltransferase [Mucilaginibacter myungsuensis]|uniref:GNAT family N-acetyltransferase n=1 Tax=Mucilaginibacter myungsuensis TaxID=649104 RepID=UPI001D16410E|nr:GNAT family N-acetyltransferase [Mucilaginibacter myungsuensis]MDN3599814.1 GNAT family N-acetyltransferase [Mucilaginibacter myungsuensis]